MTNVILCGGVGSRLWPLSRTHMPKQFARILPGETLFERTVRRNRVLGCGIFVAINEAQYPLAAAQLATQGIESVDAVIEPVGRNTAPAIALACLALDPGETVLVTPSDHVILDEDAYRVAVARAVELAETGVLVVFGIEPRYPETGFGYIELDGERVASFKEKPDLATAKRYCEEGNYAWNAGMFCFKAGVFLDELRLHAPDVHAAATAAHGRAPVGMQLRVARADMEAIPSISVDYAVMEKSKRMACVPCDIGWSDVGGFDVLYDALPGADDKARGGSPEVLEIGSRGNLVIERDRFVALIDVEDLVVVGTADALLISKRGSTQKVKDVVDRLKAGRPELTEEAAPGSDASTRLDIAPGRRLSVITQAKERWFVIRGEAEINAGGIATRCGTGMELPDSTGTPCTIANVGNVVLSIVERA
ncbi:MAG: mannose-1-phosphate guanylyltransferase [Spirochaetes bacterium]|nr:mannose-1-phosphate guanylyltransferase [Spirochaetota bacterium]